MSPLNGTVETTIETVLSDERNGVLVAVVAAGALAKAVLGLLLVLLARASRESSSSFGAAVHVGPPVEQLMTRPQPCVISSLDFL
jgi:hypothetical protein